MSIRAVVFDIGGVLVYTPETGMRQKWEARLGLNPGGLFKKLMLAWPNGHIRTIPEADVHAGLVSVLGLSASDADALLADFWEEYKGTLNVELTAYFAGLRPRYRTAILSNSFTGAREKEQAAFQFEDMTDMIIYSHEVGMAKPDPRIYELTCQRLGVAPQETVFLDDVEENIAGARAFGMNAVLFKNTAQATADIQSCLNTTS